MSLEKLKNEGHHGNSEIREGIDEEIAIIMKVNDEEASDSEDCLKTTQTVTRSKRNRKNDVKEGSNQIRGNKRHCNSECDEILLPDEIYLDILKFLLPSDLCNLALVSKRFSLIASDPNLWKDKLNQKKLKRFGLAEYFEECEIIRFKVIRLGTAATKTDLHALLNHLKSGTSKIEELKIEVDFDLGEVPHELIAETVASVKRVHWIFTKKFTVFFSVTENVLKILDKMDNFALKELTLRNPADSWVPPQVLARLNSRLDKLNVYYIADLVMFGQKYVKVEEEIKKHEFDRLPIGPIGRFVRLKPPAERTTNPNLACLVETALSSKLRTYLCHSDRDAKLLWTIFEKIFGPGEKPAISASRFRLEEYKVNRAKVSLTLMDLLDIGEVPVFNYLVDLMKIESVAVCQSQDEAKALTCRRENVPKYLASAITTDFYKFMPVNQSSYFMEPVVSKLLRDKSDPVTKSDD